jgi:hypothetical protein
LDANLGLPLLLTPLPQTLIRTIKADPLVCLISASIPLKKERLLGQDVIREFCLRISMVIGLGGWDRKDRDAETTPLGQQTGMDYNLSHFVF